MTDWFRLWHGAPTDPKWRTVAKRAGVRPVDVWGVVSMLMDRASQAAERGTVTGYDSEIIADALGVDDDEVDRIIAAMIEKAVIVDGRFPDWRRYDSGGAAGEAQRVRRERMGSEGLRDWKRLRTAVFQRDGFRCVYCGSSDQRLECDHVTPLSRGGTNDLTNLATACRPCNLSKGRKTVQEWRQ
jgi:hypothetical protein